MVALQSSLDALLKSLPQHPIPQQTLNELVAKTLLESKGKTIAENRKSQWEYLLKNEIYELAYTEGQALKEQETEYYNHMQDLLDLTLTFTEHDACEQTFPFLVLQDLLETQTIASCSHIFSWIELRADRLTSNLVPQKGKALILLRTLNDLLRRLSKMGSTTIFCGRILTFLSGVFPLGERSGVNLRGEYGPTWEGVKSLDTDSNSMQGVNEEGKQQEEGDDKMDVVSTSQPDNTASEKTEFYNTFWSLQLPFSKPTVFTTPTAFPGFKEAVNRVLPVIKEATAKERAMMGSRGAGVSGPLKRKREPDSDDASSNLNEYFFAKFLTSPDLLDLEIADTHFRRQFLFQLLILLNHLLTFTSANKVLWQTIRNRSLQMEFTLEQEDAQWVQETITKAMDELKQTSPNGRAFAETVSVILEREKNWVRWKNELCSTFDKDSWTAEVDGKKVGMFEATRAQREKMREWPKEWQHRMGSGSLTEIWDLGYRDLGDLQMPFIIGQPKEFVKLIQKEDLRMEMRKKTLTKMMERMAPRPPVVVTPPPLALSQDSAAKPPDGTAMDTSLSSSLPTHPSLPARPGSVSPAKPATPQGTPATEALPVAPTPVVAPPAPLQFPKDEQLIKLDEHKKRWAWLALRAAREQHLSLFGKIGTGDIELLAKEIEKEKQQREKPSGKTDDVLVVSGPAGDERPQGEGGEAVDVGAPDEKMEVH